MAFIVFEGLDGAGKSTLIEALKEKLDQKTLEYISTREPGGTPLAEKLRQLLLHEEDDAPVSRAELLMYEAARAQHVDTVIRPALQNNQWVICDRFTASTYAFQKGGRDLDANQIHWLNNYATNGLKPDLNVLLDLSVETSKQRMEQRVQETGVEKDRFEKEEQDFHNRVRQAYLDLANNEASRWLVLDASKTREELKSSFLLALSERGFIE